jgi:type IV pilus assembly protein PilY1
MNKNNSRHRLAAFCGALGLSLLTGAPLALADDTEVYVTNSTEGSQPNILFIVDTSGSMSTEVTIPVVYDPATTYSGSCSSSRVYWSTGSTPPSCSTSQWVPTSQNFCKAALTPLANTGRFTDAAAMWRRDWGLVGERSWTDQRWQTLQSGANTHALECEDDSGKHGSADGVWYADKDARNSASKWNSAAAKKYGYSTVYNFWSANYLNWWASTGGTMDVTRLWIVQDVARKLADRLNGVNIGLMRFDSSNTDGYQGGPVTLPIADISESRDLFKTTISGYTPSGNTPLAETFWEAYLYFTGQAVKYGLNSSPVSVATSKNPSDTSKYKSPIAEACQKNYIVYLTDGEPTEDTDANQPIYNLLGTRPKGNCPNSTSTSTSYNGICLDELAGYMNDYLDAAPGLSGIQNIVTYTVGFFSNQTLLDDTAVKGGGKYYTVDDYAGLEKSLSEIFIEILLREGLFTAPAVSVNAFNRLNHRDEIYFALFAPQDRVTWPGNVKRYRYNASFDNGAGTTPGAIVDVAGFSAIDPSTGSFRSGAKSWWSDVLDGDEVAKGGAANEQSISSRKVYTYTGSAAPSNVNLTAAASKLHEDNLTTLTPLLDIQDTNITATDLIQWARGVDLLDADRDGVTNEARKQMGDPLHTRPVLITYGGTEDSPDLTIYAMTNDGFLYALNPEDGSESFAFMPKELLPNIENLYVNEAGTNHIYGLDGPLVTRVKNTGAVTLQTSEGDFAWLYLGMRRGGKNYYALDVTNRTTPTLKWMIKGGATGDFAEMGQSWSAPAITRMNIGGTLKNVMVFAGGYDPNHDTKTTRSNDGQGRALYIADADTGALLWSGGTADTSPETFTKTFADMHYAIASDVNVLDMNGDGAADQLYVGDLGGQLWRFDVANGQSGASLVTGGVILDVGGTTTATNRRFHYAPSVALAKNDGATYLALAIGSGWREHPLDTVVDDRFYTLKQTAVFGPPRNSGGAITYTKLTESNLYDVTANLIQQGNATEQAAALAGLAASQGWYIQLEGDGEKALAQAEIFNEQIVFSSFTPAVSTTTCGGAIGAGSSYLVDLYDGRAVKNLDTTADDPNRDKPCTADGVSCVKADRKRGLKRGGIPPGAVILFPAGADPVILIGPETPFTANFGQLTQRTFWRDVPN